MIKKVFFDLDGTLLPMDQDEFTNGYFKFLIKKAEPFGYKGDELVPAIWKGTYAMVKNDGTRYNEDVFWEVFSKIIGRDTTVDKPVFEDFYANEFNKAKDICGFSEKSAAVVKELKSMGLGVVLASNPLFPMVAQVNRMNWAGLDAADFEYITSYENSRFCKPNPRYYSEILDKLGLAPEECVMIGNDATEDYAATEAGIKTFILTPCLINKQGRDISGLPHGEYDDIVPYVKSLMG